MLRNLAQWWCRHFHRGTYWPVHGTYRCSVCLRTWDVPWERPEHQTGAPSTVVGWTPAQQHLAR